MDDNWHQLQSPALIPSPLTDTVARIGGLASGVPGTFEKVRFR
jgi:hypothetical protein